MGKENIINNYMKPIVKKVIDDLMNHLMGHQINITILNIKLF